MFDPAPDGHFIRDLVVFNGLRQGSFVSKGFIFEPPDLDNAQISDLNEFQDHISLLLASLSEHQRLQVQYFCDSDYRTELLRYQAATTKMENVWTKRCRNERFLRYWQAMVDRNLRRQRLILYISRKLDGSPKAFHSAKARTSYYEAVLDQLHTEFAQVHETLAGIFAAQGARVIPMTDADHYRHYKMFLNPSLAERFDYDILDVFDPEQSIQDNCWHSEGNGQSDYGFWMDGYYHSLLVLTRWPKITHPGLIRRLTNLRLLDYTITVNIDPLPVRHEILKEEKEYERIAGDYASEKKLSLLTVMEKKQRKIAALTRGDTMPFNVQFIVRVWDKTKEGLTAKTGAIKNAINSMNGAQYFESALPSTSRKLFYETWPGWTWGRYEHRKLYGEKPVHRRHAAILRHVYGSLGNRGGDLRRLGAKSGRHQNFLR